MTMGSSISRRKFLSNAACGSMVALGWPSSLSWAVKSTPGVEPIKIVFYTDIHGRVEWDTPEAMMKAAAAINRQEAQMVLCGGDMITDGYQSSPAVVAPRWEVYKQMHQAIRPEPFFVLGNHDLVGVEPSDDSPPSVDPREDVRRQMSIHETYRSIDFRGYHFIFLDSVQVTAGENKYRGFIDDDQMSWLHADLEKVDRSTPIILVTHMPLLTAFYQMTGGLEASVPVNRGVVNNREVLAAFKHHHLLLVLQGHLHVNEMLRWHDTTFITGGAVSGKWWRGEWHGTLEGYGVLNLERDRVNWEYFTYGWDARRPSNL